MIRFARHLTVAASIVALLAGGEAMAADLPRAEALPAVQEVAAAGQPLRIMPLGDSITWGVGAPGHDSYRTELGDRLAAAGVAVDFVGSRRSGTGTDPDNEGHPGWTIAEIAERVDGWLAAAEPDVVLLHVGTNDMHLGNPDAAADLAGLLDRIHADRPDAQIIVARVIGLGRTLATGGQALRTDAYNRAVAGLVAARGAPFHLVDMSDISGIDLVDRVHPNAFGYRRMAWAWYHALDAVLNDGGSAWPSWDNPEGASRAVRCLGVTVTLPAYAKGCRTWLHRRPDGPLSARVWQLPVRRTRVHRVGNRIELRTTIHWLTD